MQTAEMEKAMEHKIKLLEAELDELKWKNTELQQFKEQQVWSKG